MQQYSPLAKTSSVAELPARSEQMLQSGWQQVRAGLRMTYGEATFRSWLGSLDIAELRENVAVITAPTRFIREWVSSHYFDTLANLCKTHIQGVVAVELYVRTPGAIPAPAVVSEGEQTSSAPVDFTLRHVENAMSSPLDARFRFENFVTGPSNELAFASAKAVASSREIVPGCNPLFLYGGVGLGKTHLLQAIAWEMKERQPDRNVVYLSAEKFMFQFIRSLRNKDVLSFKEQFRSVDVLLVDDIQFISGKESTLEEFFHTFNTLVDGNKQVVLSCDRSPSELGGMGERARSRLGWGLVADVHPSDYALRLSILHKKVEKLGVPVPEEVLMFLAEQVTTNIRELEGALNKLVLHSTLMNLPITLDGAKRILQDLLKSCERAVTIDNIQKRVAQYFQVSLQELLSARRARNIARPRQVAMYLAKQLTPKSLVEIGQRFGGRDHTTVMHAVAKVESLMLIDPEIRDAVTALDQQIRQG